MIDTGIDFVTKYKDTLALEVSKEEIKSQMDETFKIVKVYLDKMKPSEEEEKKKDGENAGEEEAAKVNEEEEDVNLDRAES